MMVRKTFEREYRETIELQYDGLYYRVIKKVYYKGEPIYSVSMLITETSIEKVIDRIEEKEKNTGKMGMGWLLPWREYKYHTYKRFKHKPEFMEKFRKELRPKLIAILETLMQENIKEEIRYKYLEHIIKGTISEGWINSTYKSLVVLQNHRKGQKQFRKPKNIKV